MRNVEDAFDYLSEQISERDSFTPEDVLPLIAKAMNQEKYSLPILKNAWRIIESEMKEMLEKRGYFQ